VAFNSLEFLVFGLLAFLIWPIIKKSNNSRWIGLTILSLIFYGWWDWRFLFLIIGSGLVDFICGLCIYHFSRYRRFFFLISVFINIGSLFIFKYFLFFSQIVADINDLIGFDLLNIDHDFASNIILPVGISFYTFQSLSYSIDIYRKRLKPTKNIFHFFSFLTCFPQLVAGPIVRAKDFLRQLERERKVTTIEKWNAIKMFSFGLFQKVVLADNLSFFIDSAFESKSPYDGAFFWFVVSVSFSFQIYCDFSGYSLMARAIAKWLGFHFKMNFNHPYLSTGFKAFWQRWHISLSTWFRDYVYIPIGGSKKGKIFGFIALTTTMIASGLWHGPNYTFVIWAIIHIILLQFERLTKWHRIIKSRVIVILITFLCINITWIFFRANSIDQALGIIEKLFSFEAFDGQFVMFYFDQLAFLLLGITIEIFIYLKMVKPKLFHIYKRNNLDVYLVTLCILSILFLRGEGQQFIYFQF
jgi:alginate O-acetyltransferase complex protein AlgI